MTTIAHDEDLDKAQADLAQALSAALPWSPKLTDMICKAVGDLVDATVKHAVGVAGVERALESFGEPVKPPVRNAMPPPPMPGQDAWVIVSRQGTLAKVFENEHEARREASQWYMDGPAAVAKYVAAERLERAEEDLRKVSDFYGAATQCPSCGDAGCTVDMTPGAEGLRCAACGTERDGLPVHRLAYDKLRKALQEIASGNGVAWATGVASRALAASAVLGVPPQRPIEAPSTTCSGDAPSTRCGNRGPCPGCRSCA